jgi:hypothetical protein
MQATICKDQMTAITLRRRSAWWAVVGVFMSVS